MVKEIVDACVRMGGFHMVKKEKKALEKKCFPKLNTMNRQINVRCEKLRRLVLSAFLRSLNKTQPYNHERNEF